ncbi:uncharacterized protein LOC116663322 [Camelus ferus]|uniref:Uncharacterized protein LOC116663322 n=1 Tax=Camelus ferus TaxID=419612 RepID=A0A8B8SY00_CAMFR|nr:uncharacterized protein LOC116663322 [Camelus ferus]
MREKVVQRREPTGQTGREKGQGLWEVQTGEVRGDPAAFLHHHRKPLPDVCWLSLTCRPCWGCLSSIHRCLPPGVSQLLESAGAHPLLRPCGRTASAGPGHTASLPRDDETHARGMLASSGDQVATWREPVLLAKPLVPAGEGPRLSPGPRCSRPLTVHSSRSPGPHPTVRWGHGGASPVGPSLLGADRASQACNKALQKEGLKRQCSVTVLGVRSPRRGCPRARLPPEAPGGPSLPPPATGCPRRPWLVAASPRLCSVPTGPSSLEINKQRRERALGELTVQQ